MKRIGFAACLAAAVSVVLPSRAALTTIDVADGATYDLAVGSDANARAAQGTSGTVLNLGVGCTVRLVGEMDGAGAEFPLKAGIKCLSGDFAIDGTGLTGYSSTLRWIGCVYAPKGVVTLKGFAKAKFGSASPLGGSSISTPSIAAADVAFDPAEGAEGLVFVNSAALCNALASCPWTVEDGSSLWALDKKTINVPDTDTFSADGWNFGFVMGWAVANKVVRISNGFLFYRHCSITTSDTSIGGWGGSSQDAEIANDLVLDGEDTGLRVYSNVATDHRLTGDITGTGSFRLLASSDRNVRVVFAKRAGWTGETVVTSEDGRQGAGQLTFADPAPATSRIVLSNENAARIRFRPDGWGEVPTAVTVNGISGDGDAYATVEVAPRQTLTIGTLEGGITFTGDETGTVVVENLAAGAKIRLVGGVRLQVLASADGKANVILGAADDSASGSWSLAGPATGSAIAFRATQVVPGGRIAYAGVIAFEEPWKAKPALWVDASAADTFDGLDRMPSYDPSVVTTLLKDGYPMVYRWRDCRPEQTDYLLGNPRFDGSLSGYSTVVYPVCYSGEHADAPNTRPFVSFEGSSTYLTVYRKNGSSYEKSGTLSTAYAIVVFGSHLSGGAALLGTEGGALARSTSGTYSNPVYAWKYPMTENSYQAYVDGAETAIDTSAQGFNNSWQIVSLDAKNCTVQGVGFDYSLNRRGYQRYAEVMLFSEKPTDTERRIIEEYLADKWGVTIGHSGTATPWVADLKMTLDAQVPVLTFGDSIRRDLTVNVAFTSRPKAGRYPLVANADLAAWTLGTVTGNGKYEVGLDYDADAKVLYADVKGPGLMVILK